MAAATPSHPYPNNPTWDPQPTDPEHLQGLEEENRFVLFDGDHQYICTESRNPRWLMQLGVEQPWGALEKERVNESLEDDDEVAPASPQSTNSNSSSGGGLSGWFGWGSSSSSSPETPSRPLSPDERQRKIIQDKADLRQNPVQRVFDEPEQEIWSIRGANYLDDGVKIKTPPYAMRLIGVDCFVCTDEEVDANAFIGGRKDLLVQRARAARRSYEASLSEEERKALLETLSPKPGAEAADEKDLFGHPTTHPFILIIHFLLPEAHCILYFSNGTTSPYTGTDKPFDTVLRRFLNGSDEDRRQRLKLIPNVHEGNYLVQKTTGNTPAILGTKMTQHHKVSPSSEDNYFEISIDIRSSKIARSILGVVRGYTRSVVMDLGFVIEGQSPTELPERVLGAVRCHRFDFEKMCQLPRGAEGGERIPEELKQAEQ